MIDNLGTKTLAPRIHFTESVITCFKNSIISYSCLQQANGSQRNLEENQLNTEQEVHGENVSRYDENESNNNGSANTHLIHLHIQSQLLPLLLDDCLSINWKQMIGYNEVEATLLSIVSENNKKKEELSSVLCTERNTVSPASLQKQTFCPTFKRYNTNKCTADK